MTLQELIKTLQQIALTQPNVRTATDGDIYEAMNGNPSVKYGVFHITQNTHQSYDDRDVYGLNLFYVDRNEDDDVNTLQIQSIGKSVIDNIVRTFAEEFDGDFPTITYTPFTQRFKDDTAGVFAGINMEVYKDWICPDTYGEFITDMNVVRNQNKTIKITDSGIYVVVPDEGYTGLGEVVVDVEMANTVQDVKSIEITENGEYAVVADSPFLSIGKVDIDVNLPLQEKKELSVYDNGTYTISADDGYVAMKTAEVTFEYAPTPKLPDGICLTESTWETFDMNNYDWSSVFDFHEMFKNCRSLKNLITKEISPLAINNMFDSCNNLNYIEGIENWDVSKVTNMEYMFNNCENLTSLNLSNWDTSNVTNMSSLFNRCQSLTSLDLSNWDTSNVTNMEYMFQNCYKLTSLDLSNWDTSKVTNIRYMFNYCPKLTSIEGIEDWDVSKVMDISNMFNNCKNLTSLNLSNWDTSNVTNMSSLFNRCQSLTSLDLSNWDTSNVIYMSYLFQNCSNLTEIRMGGDVSNVTNISYMFSGVGNGGVFYYPKEYDYSKIINNLPQSWTAIAY